MRPNCLTINTIYMITALTFGLALLLSTLVVGNIILVASNKGSESSNVSIGRLTAACIMWAVFYYLTH